MNFFVFYHKWYLFTFLLFFPQDPQTVVSEFMKTEPILSEINGQMNYYSVRY